MYKLYFILKQRCLLNCDSSLGINVHQVKVCCGYSCTQTNNIISWAMAMALAQRETVHLTSQSTDKNHRFDSGSEVQDYLPYSSSYNPQASINTHFNTSKRLLHIVLATLLTLTERIQRLCVIPERSLFHIFFNDTATSEIYTIVVFSLIWLSYS